MEPFNSDIYVQTTVKFSLVLSLPLYICVCLDQISYNKIGNNVESIT